PDDLFLEWIVDDIDSNIPPKGNHNLLSCPQIQPTKKWRVETEQSKVSFERKKRLSILLDKLEEKLDEVHGTQMEHTMGYVSLKVIKESRKVMDSYHAELEGSV
ncbi:hypothetical protein HK405_001239, partial [Cladochytrium tenue]